MYHHHFFSVLFSHRTKSTPTPTASFSVNGMPMEAVDYEKLKQVDLICHLSATLKCQRSCHATTPDDQMYLLYTVHTGLHTTIAQAAGFSFLQL